MRLILGSGSPRRQQMLRDLGVAFETHAPDILEKKLRGEPPLHFVRRLAREKAERVVADLSLEAEQGPWVVLSADTIVVHARAVLGKPESAEDALRMLKRLSGESHEVITAFHWAGRSASALKSVGAFQRTKVFFADKPLDFWRWYVSTGEPMDKAGAYAAQGIGISFIEKVIGSYSNVVGLPLPQVLSLYTKAFGGDLRDRCSKN